MLGGTFWWLFISMHLYGGLVAPIAALAVLALAAFLALYYAAAGALFVAWRPTGAWAQAWLLAALWLLAELMRVSLFTGFPWGEGGYAHVDGWGRTLASTIGVHGLTWLAAFSSALVVCTSQDSRTRRRWGVAAATVAAAIALMWLPIDRPTGASRPALALTLVQGNIAQDEKFQPGSGVVDALNFYGEQLAAVQTALVVLPETAIPMLPDQLPAAYWASLQARFAAGGQAALIGIPLGSAQEGYTNSVLGLRPAQAPYRYDKHHLVPFGEFIPPLFRWFTELLHIPLGDFNRGAVGQPSLAWMGERRAPNICYEDLFGEELGARFRDPASAPTMFVNLSNIGWFGNTVAIDQHLHISRMRALEFARPMIRATNTGATVVINAQGEVTHSLPRHTRGVLQAEAQGSEHMTTYARWVSSWGLAPWWLLGLASLMAAWLAARRRRMTCQSV
jgi:apolipoprotein N-acyltransferase